MNKLFCAIIAVLVLSACNQKGSETTENGSDTTAKVVAVEEAPVFEFEKEIFDFGVITMGEKVHYDFKFKNVGKTPLIITDASATCGCTIPEYPKTPIKPGDSGVIKVVFDSANKFGMQDKVVTLTSNANPTTTNLHIVGEIKEAKK